MNLPVLRESARRWDATLSIYVPAFVLATGTSIAAPALPLLAKSFNVGFGTAALVLVANQFGAMLATIPIGYLIGRVGSRRLVLFGPMFVAVASFLIVTTQSFPQLLAYKFLEGCAMQMWMIGRLELITAGGGSRRATQISRMWGMDATGRLMGPAIGGVVAVAWGLRAPFLVYGVLALLAIIPSFFSSSMALAKTADTAHNQESRVDPRTWIEIVRSPAITMLLVTALISALARASLFGGTLDLYAVYAYGIGPQTVGLLAAAGGLVGLPFNFITGPLMDRFGRKTTLVPGFCLLSAALAGMAVAALAHWPFTGYIVVFLLTRLAMGTVNGSMQVVGSDVAPANARGPFLGIWAFTQQFGVFLSPAMFAFVAVAVSFGASFVLLGVLSLTTALLIQRHTFEPASIRRVEPSEAAIAAT